MPASRYAALAAALRERIDRYNAALDLDEHADPAEILSPATAALRRQLLVAALTGEQGQVAQIDATDAEPFWLAAWAAEFRNNAFTQTGDDQRARDEAATAMRLFLVVDLVQPALVPSAYRALLDSMNSRGAVLDLSFRERELAEEMIVDDGADLAALDLAIALLRRSIDHAPDTSGITWQALTRALWKRYELSADLADVAAAIDATGRWLPLTEGAGRALALMQLGVMQRTLGRLKRSPDDLHRAVASTRAALAEGAFDAAGRADALSMLALALHDLFELLRDQRHLAEAVAVAREAAGADVQQGLATRLGNLGLVLVTQHYHHRSADDLPELVDVARRAVALPGSRHQRGIASGLLSAALEAKARMTGRLVYLNEAIETAEESVAALDGHPEQPSHLHNLAKARYERFRRTGNLTDLDGAITAARSAGAASGDDPRRAQRLSLLAGALDSRYRLRDDIDDLLAAVAAAEEAVLCSSPFAAEYATLLSNLGNARKALAEWTGAHTDVDAAIEVAERAVTIDGTDSAARPVRLLNVVGCYVLRFRVTSDIADLDHAIDLLREALARLSLSDPERCTYQSELGQRLAERHAAAPDRTGRTIAEAIVLLREAANLTTAPAIDRLLAAARWGAVAATYALAEEAAEGDATAVRLLSSAAWHGLDRRSQESQLRTWSPIITGAAAHAIGLGRTAAAVEVLEQGRGVLWSHRLRLDTDLAALRARRKDLADRLDEIRTAWV